MTSPSITVVGAGIFGIWQAYTLAKAGHRVRLVEATSEPFAKAASVFAGAMLAPYCEAESAERVVQELGLRGLELWRLHYPGVVANGTLVVAGSRDRAELVRFARLTQGFEHADGEAIAALEPDLEGRFANGLYFHLEAHMAPCVAMSFMLGAARKAGVEVALSTPWDGVTPHAGLTIDCRGMGAVQQVEGLRGVRGERVLVRTDEVTLSRPVRLLHPRHPLYVVPWGMGQYMIGATVIESADTSPMTVRSALELLGLAYALHPAFGEAEIMDMGAGVRPALPDNIPKARIEAAGRTIRVNGAYRHGFLLAPVLAEAVAAWIATGEGHALVVNG